MLSRLLSFSLDLVPPQFREDILMATSLFLKLVSMETISKGLEIYDAHESHHSRWVTLSHFVDVFFAPLFSTVEGSRFKSLVLIEAYSEVCMKMNVMCLAVELSRSCHKQLVVEQGLLDCLVCLPWVLEKKWSSVVRAVVNLFGEDMDLPVPTLHSLAAVSLAKDGRFNIQNMFKF